MSVTKIIDEENITLVQGVNGILLHEEDWMKEKEEDWMKEKEERKD